MGYHDEEEVLTGAERYRQRIEGNASSSYRPTGFDLDGLTDEIEVVTADDSKDAGEETAPVDDLGREISFLGKWIRDRRKVLGISQHELSMRTRLPQSQISLFEIKGVHPTRETSDSLAKGLGMPPGQFWSIVARSRDAWKYGAVGEPERVSISGRVTPEARLFVVEEAKERGINMTRHVGDILERYYLNRKDK